jgi:hypothetical protein
MGHQNLTTLGGGVPLPETEIARGSGENLTPQLCGPLIIGLLQNEGAIGSAAREMMINPWLPRIWIKQFFMEEIRSRASMLEQEDLSRSQQTSLNRRRCVSERQRGLGLFVLENQSCLSVTSLI